MIEPAFGEGRSVEQHAVDVDQPTAPAGAESLNEIGELRMLVFPDEAYARHVVTPS
jgi:hypothetical protein